MGCRGSRLRVRTKKLDPERDGKPFVWPLIIHDILMLGHASIPLDDFTIDLTGYRLNHRDFSLRLTPIKNRSRVCRFQTVETKYLGHFVVTIEQLSLDGEPSLAQPRNKNRNKTRRDRQENGDLYLIIMQHTIDQAIMGRWLFNPETGRSISMRQLPT